MHYFVGAMLWQLKVFIDLNIIVRRLSQKIYDLLKSMQNKKQRIYPDNQLCDLRVNQCFYTYIRSIGMSTRFREFSVTMNL